MFDKKKTNDFKLNIIYKIRYGSDVFGTTTADSDNDIRGIYLPTLYNHLAFIEHKTLNIITPEYDIVYHPFKKYIKLAMRCNPSALEWLYVPEKDIIDIKKEGRLLRDSRDLFLSKEAYFRFSGFATSEWRRAMGVSRRKMGEKRREQIEKYGYDLKAAMNTIRLLQQCRELLLDRLIIMSRPNADYLKDVKLGRIRLAEVKYEYENATKELNIAYQKSSLKEKSNINKINDFMVDIITQGANR